MDQLVCAYFSAKRTMDLHAKLGCDCQPLLIVRQGGNSLTFLGLHSDPNAPGAGASWSLQCLPSTTFVSPGFL